MKKNPVFMSIVLVAIVSIFASASLKAYASPYADLYINLNFEESDKEKVFQVISELRSIPIYLVSQSGNVFEFGLMKYLSTQRSQFDGNTYEYYCDFDRDNVNGAQTTETGVYTIESNKTIDSYVSSIGADLWEKRGYKNYTLKGEIYISAVYGSSGFDGTANISFVKSTDE
jgi:hypothetical protein